MEETFKQFPQGKETTWNHRFQFFTKAVAVFLEYPEKSQVQCNRVNDWLTAITHEGKDKVIFESLFTKEHALVHITTMRMDEKDRRKPRSGQPQQSLQQNQLPSLPQERPRRR